MDPPAPVPFLTRAKSFIRSPISAQSSQSQLLQRTKSRAQLVNLEPYRGSEKSIIKVQALCRGRINRNSYKIYAKKQQHRMKVAWELLHTEQIYVQNLTTVVEIFLVPLREMINEKDKKPFVSSTELRKIFSEIEAILNVNRKLLNDLSPRIDQWTPSQLIGDVFLFLFNFLKIYTQYIADYNTKISTIRECMERPEFTKFLAECAKRSEVGNQTLGSFLIQPIQRIPRYEMLLADLFKHTPEDHKDYHNLKLATNKIHEVALYVEMKKADAEAYSKVLELQNSFTGLEGTLALPHRRFVREDTLLIAPKGEERIFFLFNDKLVITKKAKIDRYKVIKSVDIGSLAIRDVRDEDDSFEFVIKDGGGVNVMKVSSKLHSNPLKSKTDWKNDFWNTKDSFTRSSGTILEAQTKNNLKGSASDNQQNKHLAGWDAPIESNPTSLSRSRLKSVLTSSMANYGPMAHRLRSGSVDRELPTINSSIALNPTLRSPPLSPTSNISNDATGEKGTMLSNIKNIFWKRKSFNQNPASNNHNSYTQLNPSPPSSRKSMFVPKKGSPESKSEEKITAPALFASRSEFNRKMEDNSLLSPTATSHTERPYVPAPFSLSDPLSNGQEQGQASNANVNPLSRATTLPIPDSSSTSTESDSSVPVIAPSADGLDTSSITHKLSINEGHQDQEPHQTHDPHSEAPSEDPPTHEQHENDENEGVAPLLARPSATSDTDIHPHTQSVTEGQGEGTIQLSSTQTESSDPPTSATGSCAQKSVLGMVPVIAADPPVSSISVTPTNSTGITLRTNNTRGNSYRSITPNSLRPLPKIPGSELPTRSLNLSPRVFENKSSQPLLPSTTTGCSLSSSSARKGWLQVPSAKAGGNSPRSIIVAGNRSPRSVSPVKSMSDSTSTTTNGPILDTIRPRRSNAHQKTRSSHSRSISPSSRSPRHISANPSPTSSPGPTPRDIERMRVTQSNKIDSLQVEGRVEPSDDKPVGGMDIPKKMETQFSPERNSFDDDYGIDEDAVDADDDESESDDEETYEYEEYDVTDE
eukprot:TRINITY_DN15037_c0_g1_i1.p1 TRINITY_DN15037_c0_g1~~TRINITY_DN15037_c0_g1_i1.p1  ORF type:complete len:1038 (-),score=173.55 TRINITY_DN15037_c0_g1_i1:67-3180(-)